MKTKKIIIFLLSSILLVSCTSRKNPDYYATAEQRAELPFFVSKLETPNAAIQASYKKGDTYTLSSIDGSVFSSFLKNITLRPITYKECNDWDDLDNIVEVHLGEEDLHLCLKENKTGIVIQAFVDQEYSPYPAFATTAFTVSGSDGEYLYEQTKQLIDSSKKLEN